MAKCAVGDCENDGRTRGWCEMHYTRWKRHGDPEFTCTPGGGKHWDFVRRAAEYDGSECLTWPFGKLPNGRGSMKFEGKTVGAHRMVCIEAHGNPPFPEAEAAHNCGKGHEGCVSGGHLYWATSKQNQADRIKHGTAKLGEDNPVAKLSPDDVRAIRGDRRPQTQIAADYGITQAAVSLIVTRKNWAHLV